MLCFARSHVGACVMDMTFGLLLIATIISMYLAGRIAERRGRSFKNWACIAGFLLGPLALPLLFLMPDLHPKNGDHAEGPRLSFKGPGQPGHCRRNDLTRITAKTQHQRRLL